MYLVVNIQKRLPNYTLEVAFDLKEKPLGIIGNSGSGKSMTLRCLAGIETPTKGKIILGDRVLFDSARGINLPSRERKVSYLFQNYALFPHMSVAQNIAYGLRDLSKTAKARQVAIQLEMLQLQGLEHRYPHQLSGGQQQRVALARALAPNPELLLLDEPFSALDTHLRNELEKQLIKTLQSYQGTTLFVTHNLEEAYRICQQLLVFSGGKVIAGGDKKVIFQNPGTLTVGQLTGCKNFSKIRAIAPQCIKAPDWNCILHVVEPIPEGAAYVGIRAHHLTFPTSSEQPNTFLCWLVWKSETPHRMSLYLKLNSPPSHDQDYHLQAEVFREKWDNLKDRPLPWQIHLDPLRLFLTQE